ncbi:helix-turn-helix transcriptional regulator [Marinicrinis lubricantis]|uniref:Helix-turn-helix domain-containing protein n=1 Tax=Marinicrinis lubricantis TaxID=2086470 RepID=A0ABW1IN77_9BACL
MNREMLKENRVHGDPMYPVSVYPITEIEGPMILDPHWHDEMEFLLVTEGKALFQIDMAHYELHAGQAVFINSGELHAGFPIEDASCSFTAVVFHPELLGSSSYDVMQKKYVDPLLKKQVFPPTLISNEQPWELEVLQLLKQIIADNSAESPAYEFSTKARLLLMMAQLFSQAPSAPPRKNYAADSYKLERIKSVIDYVHQHFDEPLRLKDLAEQVNMSEGHFCRFFKQMMKKSPVEYMNHYRTQKAARLLENSDKKIVEIAMDVGFDNLSYFITVFKQFVGCTPSQYRKQVQRAVLEL